MDQIDNGEEGAYDTQPKTETVSVVEQPKYNSMNRDDRHSNPDISFAVNMLDSRQVTIHDDEIQSRNHYEKISGVILSGKLNQPSLGAGSCLQDQPNPHGDEYKSPKQQDTSHGTTTFGFSRITKVHPSPVAKQNKAAGIINGSQDTLELITVAQISEDDILKRKATEHLPDAIDFGINLKKLEQSQEENFPVEDTQVPQSKMTIAIDREHLNASKQKTTIARKTVNYETHEKLVEQRVLSSQETKQLTIGEGGEKDKNSKLGLGSNLPRLSEVSEQSPINFMQPASIKQEPVEVSYQNSVDQNYQAREDECDKEVNKSLLNKEDKESIERSNKRMSHILEPYQNKLNETERLPQVSNDLKGKQKSLIMPRDQQGIELKKDLLRIDELQHLNNSLQSSKRESNNKISKPRGSCAQSSSQKQSGNHSVQVNAGSIMNISDNAKNHNCKYTKNRRESFMPNGILRDPRFFLEQIKKNLKLEEIGEDATENQMINNIEKIEAERRHVTTNNNIASDGLIDDEDIEVRKTIDKNWKGVKFQIKALKLLLAKEYDRFMILASIIFIMAVVIYVLIGPDYINLEDESWDLASLVVNSTIILLLFIYIIDNMIQAVAYKCDCIKQPLQIFWNILVFILVAMSFLEIFVKDENRVRIKRLQCNFFVLLIKIVSGFNKIHMSNISLKNKIQRQQYLGSRICGFKHIEVEEGNSTLELDDEKFIMGAIDNTLMTPQEKILKILKSMRQNVQGNDYLFYKDLGYCIKVVSSGELFNINLQEDNFMKSERIFRQQLFKSNRHKLHRRLTMNLAPNYEKKGFQDSIGWAQHYHKQRQNAKDHSTPKVGLNTKYNKLQPNFNPDLMKIKSVKSDMSYEQSSQTSQKDFTPITPGINIMTSKIITPQIIEQKMKCPPQVSLELEKIQQYAFNIFNVQSLMKGHELSTTIGYILAKEEIFEEVNLNKLKFFPFMQRISQLYKEITYHNRTHAADLAQTFYHVTTLGEMAQKTDMDKFELMTYVLAAACHDVEHPGFNNQYLIETRHAIANVYNDQSVLENHHIATTFRVLNEENGMFNIFDQFNREEYKQMRQMMIGAILATDMSEHFSKFGQFKGKVLDPDFDAMTNENKKMVFEMVFHLCDISNATKPYDICQKWTDLLFIEFFNQGDLEKQKGLNISMFMDRKTTNIASCQMGFIDFIIKPSFEVTSMLLPQLYRFNEGVENNKKQWETRIAEYEPLRKNYPSKRLSIKSDGVRSNKSTFHNQSKNINKATNSNNKSKSFSSSSQSESSDYQQQQPIQKTIELQDLDKEVEAIKEEEQPEQPKIKLL